MLELKLIDKKVELYELFNKIRLNSYIKEYTPELSIIKGIRYNSKDKYLKSKIINALEEIESHNYYNPKSFENSKIYECLGVRIAKKIVTKLFKNKGFGDNYYIDNNRNLDSLINYEKLTRFNEKVHLTSIACLSFSDLWPINIANFYLIMIQRYNRARIVNTLNYILKEIHCK